MTQPDTLHTKTLYRIPGLDGTWRITTLRTTNMAADGKATLDLVKVQDDDDSVVSAALLSADPSKIPQPEPTNFHDRIRDAESVMSEPKIEYGWPDVQIFPRPVLGYDVLVITDRRGLGGYGWRGFAFTWRGAVRLADRMRRVA